MMKQRIKTLLKSIPGINFLVKTKTWRSFRHKIVLMTAERRNATFTDFMRFPAQYEVLSGPVLDFLLLGKIDRNLKIIVLGCSNGAEPYSVASILKSRHPEVGFKIHAYDIYREIISKAKNATYTHDEIFSNPRITSDFINNTFYVEDHFYHIKKEIAKDVYFDIADALDPDLKKCIGTADIVLAQNFLVHMKPKVAKGAFNNICSLLNPKAALLIDGMDIGLRQKLTRKNKLIPLEYRIEEIHNEAKRARGEGWPYSYWDLEPFSAARREWQRRYSTIFLKEINTFYREYRVRSNYPQTDKEEKQH